MIDAGAVVHARGRMHVVHGSTVLSRALNALLRLPRAGDDVEVRLTISREHGVQQWTRTFDGVRFSSEQREIAPGIIAERFGAVEFRFRVERTAGRTQYSQIGARLRLGPLHIPLGGVLAPTVEGLARETAPGSFNVRVRATWPPAGLLLAYDGDVRIEPPSA